MESILKLQKDLKDLGIYRDYKKYLDLLKQDANFSDKLDELHYLSKKIINDKEFGLSNQQLLDEKDYKKTLEYLETNPIFNLYVEKSEELQNILSIIFNTISDALNKDFA